MLRPATLLLIAALTLTAQAEEGYDPGNPFSDKRIAPVPAAEGGAKAYGFYSHGCVVGAVPILPDNGEDWVGMRPSRRRDYGMPEMKDFLIYLSKENGRIARGDIGQANGGPTIGGHASHEMGLDADLWYEILPKGVDYSLKDRETREAPTIAEQGMDPKTHALISKMIDGKWTPELRQLLRTAAEYPGTERIFVSPPIKAQLCKDFPDNPKWLAKLRPYYDHMDHFHVRLACPASSTKCVHQDPVPVESPDKDPTQVGCAGPDLTWWTDPTVKPLKKNDKDSDPSYLAEQIYDDLHKNDPPKPNQPPKIPRWKAHMQDKGFPQECKELAAKIQVQIDSLNANSQNTQIAR